MRGGEEERRRRKGRGVGKRRKKKEERRGEDKRGIREGGEWRKMRWNGGEEEKKSEEKSSCIQQHYDICSTSKSMIESTTRSRMLRRAGVTISVIKRIPPKASRAHAFASSECRTIASGTQCQK